MHVTRRRFTGQAARSLLGGAAMMLHACAGTGELATPELPGDRIGQIGTNHGHEAILTAVELLRGGALRLDLRGRSTHTHTLELSAEEVSLIRAGRRVQRLSSADYEDKHDHEVTFN